MKKKLMFLALGVVAACSVAFSQINVNETVNSTAVNGQVATVMPNSTLAINSFITFTMSGVQYTFQVVQTPATGNSTQFLKDVANAIGNAFNTNSVSGSGGISGQQRFGSNFGEYALNYVSDQRVPFDLGLSAVLGAGAIGAFKTARRRKKEQEMAV